MPTDLYFLSRFRSETDGAAAVIVALCLMMLMGFVALGIDTGSLYRERHKLQIVTDLAALSAVPEPTFANMRVTAANSENGAASASIRTLITGRYLRNPAIPREERFSPLPINHDLVNAVSVGLQDDAPLHFAQILTKDQFVTLTAKSLAARTGAVSYFLDSALIELDGAALDDFLSEAFQVSVSLTASDRTVLAEATFSAGDILQSLAEQIGFSDPNPANILNAEVTLAQVIAALEQVGSTNLITALGGLGNSLPNALVPVSDIIGGIDPDLGLTVIDFLEDVELTALDVLTAVATREAARQPFQLDANVQVPGLLSQNISLIANEPPAHSGWIAMGEKGSTLYRSDMRLLIDTDIEPSILGGIGVGISTTRLRVPLLLELAGATATLDQMSCSEKRSDIVAEFITAPTALHPSNGTAIAALYLGEIDTFDITGQAPIDPSALGFADLLDLSITIPVPLLPDIKVGPITLQARSHALVGQSNTDRVLFSRQDIETGNTSKSFGSERILQSTVQSLFDPGSLELRIKPGQESLVSGPVSGLLQTVLTALPGQILQTLVTPVDAILDTALSDLGLALGSGGLTVEALHCERPRLVQ